MTEKWCRTYLQSLEKVADGFRCSVDALRGHSTVDLRPAFERTMFEHRRLLEELLARALVSAGYEPTPEGATKAAKLGRIEIQHRGNPNVGCYDAVLFDGKLFEGKVVYMGQLVKLKDLLERAR